MLMQLKYNYLDWKVPGLQDRDVKQNMQPLADVGK